MRFGSVRRRRQAIESAPPGRVSHTGFSGTASPRSASQPADARPKPADARPRPAVAKLSPPLRSARRESSVVMPLVPGLLLLLLLHLLLQLLDEELLLGIAHLALRPAEAALRSGLGRI